MSRESVTTCIVQGCDNQHTPPRHIRVGTCRRPSLVAFATGQLAHQTSPSTESANKNLIFSFWSSKVHQACLVHLPPLVINGFCVDSRTHLHRVIGAMACAMTSIVLLNIARVPAEAVVDALMMRFQSEALPASRIGRGVRDQEYHRLTLLPQAPEGAHHRRPLALQIPEASASQHRAGERELHTSFPARHTTSPHGTRQPTRRHSCPSTSACCRISSANCHPS